MNSYERTKRICKVIVLVLGILSINNIILTIRNYSYAYFEKNVKTGVKLKITTLDEMPVKEGIAVDIIKATLGKMGGVIGVTTSDTEVKTDSNSIREYRYSGPKVNNYAYFNCETGLPQNADNCEIWRIIGVFKDESGNEHLKIVKNEKLNGEMFPQNYIIGGTTYTIRMYYSNAVYWNKKTTGSNNDWATAGLQYWLNTESDGQGNQGYLSYLKSNTKSMIEKTKYYLGTLTYKSEAGSFEMWDTPKEAYKYERDVASCNNNTGSSPTTSGCRVWKGNQATWTGQVALMYPSDYGFSVSSENNNWNKQFKDFSTIKSESWFNGIVGWLLSPGNNGNYDATYLASDGFVGRNLVGDGAASVFPTLYLKHETMIIGGSGKEGNCYQLSM